MYSVWLCFSVASLVKWNAKNVLFSISPFTACSLVFSSVLCCGSWNVRQNRKTAACQSDAFRNWELVTFIELGSCLCYAIILTLSLLADWMEDDEKISLRCLRNVWSLKSHVKRFSAVKNIRVNIRFSVSMVLRFFVLFPSTCHFFFILFQTLWHPEKYFNRR